MSARRLVAVTAVLAALVTMAAPGTASTGGQAAATGVAAVAGEVDLDITTSGAIGGLQPIVDWLTDEPILSGQQVTAVQAGTPPEPEGEESDALGPVEAGSVLRVEAVTAGTQRVESGVLSAEAGIGGGRVDVLGISVLDVGPVGSRVTTHPDQPPTATASVSGLEVFSSAVTPGEQVERSLELSTDQVLDALAGVVPGLSAVTGFAARVASAGGRIDVAVGSLEEVDDDAGSSRAIGLNAEVDLSLNLRLCVPELGGDGCAGEVAIRGDARVLDLQVAESQVQRPASLESPGLPGWVAPLAFLTVALFVTAGAFVAHRRDRQRAMSTTHQKATW